jgi:hypothetical protein
MSRIKVGYISYFSSSNSSSNRSSRNYSFHNQTSTLRPKIQICISQSYQSFPNAAIKGESPILSRRMQNMGLKVIISKRSDTRTKKVVKEV